MTIVHMTPGSVTIQIGERRATVHGEFFPGRGVGPTSFEAATERFRTWDDGTALTDADRRAVLDDLIAEGRSRGWTVTVF